MNSELVLSAHTIRAGNIEINNTFSGVSDFNAIGLRQKSTTAGYTFLPNDYLIVGLDALNYFLPIASTNGRVCLVKNNSGVAINVQTSGGETIDGVVPPYILNDKECLTLISDKDNGVWYIISKKL
jgi:hypothetical protein